MVPEGTDAQARKNSARNWANIGKGEGRHVSNDPQQGFEIESVAKRWSRESNRELFRVKDPRGFVLEISPSNFLKILNDTVVDHGKIKGKLAWVRHGSDNLLLPADSEDYSTALKETEVRQNDLSMGDIELGWTVRFQRGMSGQYLGRWDIVKRIRRRHKNLKSVTELGVEVNTNRKYVFHDKESDTLIVHGSPTPGYVEDREALTYEEAAERVNSVDDINKAGQRSYYYAIGFTRDRGKSASLELDCIGSEPEDVCYGLRNGEYVKFHVGRNANRHVPVNFWPNRGASYNKPPVVLEPDEMREFPVERQGRGMYGNNYDHLVEKYPPDPSEYGPWYKVSATWNTGERSQDEKAYFT
jgi:hypothetical protein